jgi:hypothetical protein
LIGSPGSGSDQKTEDTDFGALETLGWRQLAVLPPELVTEALKHAPDRIEMSDDDVVVVASHDCDVCCRQATEPDVELMAIAKLQGGTLDGNFTNLKSPRQLQFATRGEGPGLAPGAAYEAHANRRWWVPRALLGTSGPSEVLVSDPPELVARWLGRRYDRPAFPTTFNDRISPVDARIARLLRPESDTITGLFVTLDSEADLPDGVSYNVLLVGMIREDRDDDDTRRRANELVGEVSAHLSSCAGIEVPDYAVKSEAEITLADYRKLRRLDHDSLSFREGSSDELPPTQA